MAKDALEDLDVLRPLVALLPELIADGASFGSFPPKERRARDSIFVMFDFNDLGERFHTIGDASSAGISLADWDEWEREEMWERFRDDPAFIASAGARDIRRLVVRIVGNERFCEGAMQTALECGLVERAVRRAAELLDASSGGAGPNQVSPTDRTAGRTHHEDR